MLRMSDKTWVSARRLPMKKTSTNRLLSLSSLVRVAPRTYVGHMCWRHISHD
jgi:hypothetical protein